LVGGACACCGGGRRTSGQHDYETQPSKLRGDCKRIARNQKQMTWTAQKAGRNSARKRGEAHGGPEKKSKGHYWPGGLFATIRIQS